MTGILPKNDKTFGQMFSNQTHQAVKLISTRMTRYQELFFHLIYSLGLFAYDDNDIQLEDKCHVQSHPETEFRRCFTVFPFDFFKNKMKESIELICFF